MKVRTQFADGEIDYDGSQIGSLWAYREFGLKGDCIVAFVGGCDVKPEYMVDVEDLRAGEKIFSRKMLHFIAEHFDANLEAAIMRQRLLAAIAKDTIEVNHPDVGEKIYRINENLFLGDAKMSVSIATITPVSTKIHFGINIVSAGTPVKAAGLEDAGIEARDYGEAVLAAYAGEIRSACEARCKVRAAR